jgi:DNA-binding GntR family transcriptional regulator
VDLATTHGAARHTVRAALRALAAEGLVVIEPNRGARVAGLGQLEVAGLHALRVILEVGAARMALERGGGRLPAAVHARADAFAALCRRDPEPPWSDIVTAHGELHEALVAAAGHPRVTAAHRGLSTELRLFLVQARPHFSARGLADDHLALLAGLEAEGTDALERHLQASARALTGAPPSSPAAAPAAPACRGRPVTI